MPPMDYRFLIVAHEATDVELVNRGPVAFTNNPDNVFCDAVRCVFDLRIVTLEAREIAS